MRIGIDARLWNESGVGRYTRNLVTQLTKIDKKNEYVLFVLDKDYENIKKNWKLERTKELACLTSVAFGNWKLRRADVRWHTIGEQLRFPQILYKENLDLVHFPYFSVPIFYNRPFIVTIHDLILHHFPTGQASTLPFPFYRAKLLGYKFVISQAAQKAQKIITVSNATKQEIIDHLHVDANKVVVTYEGVNKKIRNSKFEIRNKSQNTKYQIPNTKYFLYVGNAYPHKNLEKLLEVLARIKNKESRIKLVLVGREDYFYKRLKEKVRQMNLEDSVVFYGETTDEELTSLYKNALALVMPSLMEGFGLPALEAMRNDCLVLASDIPSLHEVCEDTAIYFNPHDINDMQRKIEKVISGSKEEFQDIVNYAKKRSHTFSWQKMAKETLAVYESSHNI